MNLKLLKAGYPSIDIKFADRLAYCNIFDGSHVKHNLEAMKKCLQAMGTKDWIVISRSCREV